MESRVESSSPTPGDLSSSDFWNLIKERDGLILLQSQKIETLERTVHKLQQENADLRRNMVKTEPESVTSARANEELLRQVARSRSIGGTANDHSGRPVKVTTLQSVGGSIVRRQRSLRRNEEELIKRSRAQSNSYELSQDLQDKQVEMLERRYGGSIKSRRAAKIIQRAYRQYSMNKNFQKLRNSVAERRHSKLGRSNTVWSDRVFTDAQYTMGATVIPNGDLTNKRSGDLYSNDPRKRLTETSDQPRVLQQMSLDQGYNHFDMQKIRTSRRDKRLERCHEVDLTDNGHHLDVRRKTGEENNNRNSCPEMNDSSASDSPQVTPFVSATDIHSLDFETLVENKATDVLTDSFHSDASHDVTVLGFQRASGVSLTSNMSTDTLGSNRSINSSYENFRQLESSDSSSITSSQTDVHKDVSPDRSRTRDQKLMQEQTVRYLMNSSEVKYRSRKDSGQGEPNSSSSRKPTVSSRAPEISPIWKRKNGNLNGSTGSISKLDAKRMSNISETSEPDSENHYSSSPSSENVSADNNSIGSDSITYQRRMRGLSVTPDHPHAVPKSSDKQRKRVYRIGLNLFNKKPEKGLTFLCEHGFINESPDMVARFLITRKGLSKQMIGEYLGNLQNQFNMDVLCCFAEEIDLSGMQVDMALRKFQSYFRMPGEAQKIERLMEVFAERYTQCNPDQVKNFTNPDTVLLLAFAIIMLNTDLHNASIKAERKMKQEDFVKNLRGIDDDDDVDRDLLVGIYDRVKAQEFRPGVDHVTQVMKVEQTIVGNRKPALALPHRRLVCYCRLYQVHDPNKKEKIGLHQREVFLFNDLLLVTKIFSKKKSGITYSFKQSYSLCDMQVYLFETTHYTFGIRLVNNLDNKVLITFNARNDHDRQKFVEDLKEAILECNGMEAMRIDEQQRHNPQHVPLDRHYSNDDTRITMFDYMKTSDPNSNRLSAPDYSGLKQSYPLSNSLTDLCAAQAMRRGSSGGSLDSGVHSGSTGSANSTELSFGSHGSQSSLMKGLALTTSAVTNTSKMAVGQPRAKASASTLKQRPVPEGTEV